MKLFPTLTAAAAALLVPREARGAAAPAQAASAAVPPTNAAAVHQVKVVVYQMNHRRLHALFHQFAPRQQAKIGEGRLVAREAKEFADTPGFRITVMAIKKVTRGRGHLYGYGAALLPYASVTYTEKVYERRYGSYTDTATMRLVYVGGAWRYALSERDIAAIRGER